MTALAHQGDFRALQLFEQIPAGHIGVVVTKANFEPHLRRGEIAIVDTGDKERQLGELYVITLSEGTPRMSLAIVQLIHSFFRADVPPVGVWYAFGLAGTGDTVFEGRRLRYVDGPLGFEHWPGKCVGRIVGFMAPKWEGRRA